MEFSRVARDKQHYFIFTKFKCKWTCQVLGKKRIEWNNTQLNQCSKNQIEITFILQKKL